MSRLPAALLICTFAITPSGCGQSGPQLGSVRGTVTMDGEALANAVVTFVPEAGGRPAVGQTDTNGRYELVFAQGQGALVGPHKVRVTSVAPQAPAVELSEEEALAMAEAAENQPSKQEPFKDPIPACYNTASTLVKEVGPGKNVIDLELTSQ